MLAKVDADAAEVFGVWLFIISLRTLDQVYQEHLLDGRRLPFCFGCPYLDGRV